MTLDAECLEAQKDGCEPVDGQPEIVSWCRQEGVYGIALFVGAVVSLHPVFVLGMADNASTAARRGIHCRFPVVLPSFWPPNALRSRQRICQNMGQTGPVASIFGRMVCHGCPS